MLVLLISEGRGGILTLAAQRCPRIFARRGRVCGGRKGSCAARVLGDDEA